MVPPGTGDFRSQVDFCGQDYGQAFSAPALLLSRGLPQLPPRGDRQGADDLVAAYHHHFVHHVDDDADMIGDDPHDVADNGPGVAAGQIEKAVLFGETGDLGFRVFQNQAVAVEAAAGVRCERLGAGVENAAVGAGAADDGRVDVECAIVPLGDACRDL